MSPTEAAKLLELSPDATAEQLEARFLELRARLEDKIAKAPTPGLKTKYRESLEQIIVAFETLTLAADSSALPVLNKPVAGVGSREPVESADPGPKSKPQAPGSPPPATPPGSKKKKSSFEFLIVAVIAATALGAGGWWVMKTRAENAEQARIAEEQRIAEDRRRVAEEQAQKQREQQLTTLRSRFAELNVGLEAITRLETVAERELSDLRSRERDAISQAKGNLTADARKLSAQVRAQDRYVSWLRNHLPSHPARLAQARSDQLLQARNPEEASAAVTAFASSLAQLRTETDAARQDTITVGTIRLESNLPGTEWIITDGFGVELKGATPAVVGDVALGRSSIVFRRARWPDIRREVEVRRDKEAEARADYEPAVLSVEVDPKDATVILAEGRRTDDGAWSLDPGRHFIEVDHPKFVPQLVPVDAAPAQKLTRRVTLGHDYTSLLVPLIRERMKQVPPNLAFQSGLSLMRHVRDAEARDILDGILMLKVEKPDDNWFFYSTVLTALDLGRSGRKHEARNLMLWVCYQEDKKLIDLPDETYINSLELCSTLSRWCAGLIAAGDENSTMPYRMRMLSSLERHDSLRLPTPAHREASVLTQIAQYLATAGCAAEARDWSNRAKATGKAKNANLDQALLEMEGDLAFEAGDWRVGVKAYRQAASLRLINGYGRLSTAVSKARQLGNREMEEAIVALVTELESEKRINTDSWDRRFYFDRIDQAKYVEARDAFLRDRSRLLLEARNNPDAVKSLDELRDILSNYSNYYRP